MFIWQLKDSNTSFTTKWSIIARARPYHNSSKRCDLCLAEKLHIIKRSNKNLLNKRSHLVSKSRYENKFYLKNNWRLSYTIAIELRSSTFSVLVQTVLHHSPLFCNSSALTIIIKNCNLSMKKVKNLEYNRWLIYKQQPRQESRFCVFHSRVYGNAMFVLCRNFHVTQCNNLEIQTCSITKTGTLSS